MGSREANKEAIALVAVSDDEQFTSVATVRNGDKWRICKVFKRQTNFVVVVKWTWGQGIGKLSGNPVALTFIKQLAWHLPSSSANIFLFFFLGVIAPRFFPAQTTSFKGIHPW